MAKSLGDIYGRERRKLLGFIRSKISNPEDAEDILQEVYANAIRTLDSTNPVDNLLGWLYRSASNKIIDWYRRKKRKPLSLDTTQVNSRQAESIETASMERYDSVGTLEELIAGSGLDPETKYMRNLVTDSLTECIDQLPPEQREVFIRNTINGETFREISEDTGVSINTLLSRKRYAVHYLRRRLTEIKHFIDGGL